MSPDSHAAHTRSQIPEKPCRCGVPHRHSVDPRTPITFNSAGNRFQIEYTTDSDSPSDPTGGRIAVYTCYHCGGRLPGRPISELSDEFEEAFRRVSARIDDCHDRTDLWAEFGEPRRVFLLGEAELGRDVRQHTWYLEEEGIKLDVQFGEDGSYEWSAAILNDNSKDPGDLIPDGEQEPLTPGASHQDEIDCNVVERHLSSEYIPVVHNADAERLEILFRSQDEPVQTEGVIPLYYCYFCGQQLVDSDVLEPFSVSSELLDELEARIDDAVAMEEFTGEFGPADRIFALGEEFAAIHRRQFEWDLDEPNARLVVIWRRDEPPEWTCICRPSEFY